MKFPLAPRPRALGTALLLGSLTLGLLPLDSRAGDGHDHGDAPPAASGPALPRFAASSELYELVGVLDGRRLTLYLDRSDDNAPVPDARLELEFDGRPLALTPQGEGVFVASLDKEPAEGAIAISASVLAGEASDLLAAELDLHHEEPAAAAPARLVSPAALWGAGALALLGLAAAGLGRLRTRRTGAAA